MGRSGQDQAEDTAYGEIIDGDCQGVEREVEEESVFNANEIDKVQQRDHDDNGQIASLKQDVGISLADHVCRGMHRSPKIQGTDRLNPDVNGDRRFERQ